MDIRGFAVAITRERLRADGSNVDGGHYKRTTYTTTWSNIKSFGWRKNPQPSDPWYAGTLKLFILDLRRPKTAVLSYIDSGRSSKEADWKMQVSDIPLRLDSAARAARFEKQLLSLLKRL